MIERVTQFAAASRKLIIMKRTFTDFERTKKKLNEMLSCHVSLLRRFLTDERMHADRKKHQ